jgi:transposase
LRRRGIEASVIHPAGVAVSREHKRAKTGRLDTAMLPRVFLGRPRGERGHRGPSASAGARLFRPSEDAKRPSRERGSLVGESMRLVNRMKSALARLGIGGLQAAIVQGAAGLEALRPPEEMPIPQDRLAEIRRDMARLARLREEIKAIDQTRLERLQQAPRQGPHAMVGIWLASSVPASRPRTCWCGRFSPRTCQELAKNLPRTCQELAGRTLRRAQERSPDTPGYGLSRGQRLQATREGTG